MKVKIENATNLEELAPERELEVELLDGASVGDLLEELDLERLEERGWFDFRRSNDGEKQRIFHSLCGRRSRGRRFNKDNVETDALRNSSSTVSRSFFQ